jgi:dephospho-CoA kinase
VGLTGGCCTGKSTVARMFSRLGAKVISADDIVHRILRENGDVTSAVVSTFGDQVLGEDGSIDRAALAGIVFADKNKLAMLTRLLHPKVRREITRVFVQAERRAACDLCVAEVPLLIEEGSLHMYDVIIAVTASYPNQLARFIQRGGTSTEDLDRRIANQMNLAEKVKLADYVIDNDGSLEQTFEQVRELHRTLRLRIGHHGCHSSLSAANTDVRGETNSAKIKPES